MAKIVDNKLLTKFNASPSKPVFDECTCYKIKDGPNDPKNLLCYTDGCIGALNNEQDERCKNYTIFPAPPELEINLEKFSRMGKIMHVCMHRSTIEGFYSCIDLEAERQGKRYTDVEKKKFAQDAQLYDESGKLIPAKDRVKKKK